MLVEVDIPLLFCGKAFHIRFAAREVTSEERFSIGILEERTGSDIVETNRQRY